MRRIKSASWPLGKAASGPARQPRLRASDERITSFLAVSYSDLKNRVLSGGTDAEVLEWCFQNGHRPSEEQIEIWNSFMLKRGWNDDLSERLASRKKESGFDRRDDIQTMFQYIDADEGRI
jgi:gluconokinase